MCLDLRRHSSGKCGPCATQSLSLASDRTHPCLTYIHSPCHAFRLSSDHTWTSAKVCPSREKAKPFAVSSSCWLEGGRNLKSAAEVWARTRNSRQVPASTCLAVRGSLCTWPDAHLALCAAQQYMVCPSVPEGALRNCSYATQGCHSHVIRPHLKRARTLDPCCTLPVESRPLGSGTNPDFPFSFPSSATGDTA